MKVLIVEPDSLTRVVLRRVLTHHSESTSESETLARALELIDQTNYDLIICECTLPDGEASTLIAKLREVRERAGIPVICTSRSRDLESLRRLVDLGVVDYVLKPCSPASMHDRLQRVLPQVADWRRRRNKLLNGVLLLVDADRNWRSLARAILDVDFEVAESSSVEEAARQFGELVERPSMVCVSDTLAGSMNGSDLARHLRAVAAHGEAAAPRMVLVSNDGAAPDPSIAAMFDGVVKRTFDAETLAAEMRRVLLAPKSAMELLIAELQGKHSGRVADRLAPALASWLGRDVDRIGVAERTIFADPTNVRATALLTGVRGEMAVLEVRAGRGDAEAIASAMLHRRVAIETGGASFLRELARRVGVQLIARFAAGEGADPLSADATRIDARVRFGGDTTEPEAEWTAALVLGVGDDARVQIAIRPLAMTPVLAAAS